MTKRATRLAVAILALMLLTVPAAAARTDAKTTSPVTIQLLSISDWHGQIDPISVSGVGNVGGAAVLSSYFKADRAANPNTLTLTAGDAFGASPPISNFFEEEPAVRSMNLMGFDADTLGNHNFDRGIAHLQRMIDLADFSYVSANLAHVEDNLRGVAPFAIFERAGVKIAVVGITNPEAPTLVFPGSFGTIQVTDPVAAANKARKAAKKAGANIFVAIAHLGATGTDPATGEPTGPLLDFAKQVKGFDVILGDHTDVAVNTVVDHTLVVENRSKGVTYARTTLVFDPHQKRTIERSAEFVTPLSSAVTPDPAIEAMLQPYRDQLAPIFGTQLGVSTVEVPRSDACGNSAGRTCESKVGNVVTDALRATYGTDFAITNSGGLRASLTCPTTDIATDFCPSFVPPPFPITRGQVNTVLPFGNVAVTLTVNGAELKTMLENGVSKMPAVDGRFAQVSGLCFTYDISAVAGSRVTGAVRQAVDGSCTGTAVDLTAASSYTLSENDFMAAGGDGYPVFSSRVTTRDIMDQAVANYVQSAGTLSPSIQGRVNCTSSGATACPTVTP
ncbi:MAG: 5'-nucleotidase C-terminal domain-containing protein [Gaiellaceae bacterium MAG52_C11]|nr:5'-nucleotidase C-terminal domain-containing protein [Candidatus Gaiellasilicea maunaloa]